MVAWPAALKVNRQGYSERPPNNVMRSDMDTGPDKLRRRTTANIRPISFKLFLKDADIVTLDTFYVTTTASGVISFDFIHPRTGVTVQARFVEEPTYERNETMWNVGISLEILP